MLKWRNVNTGPNKIKWNKRDDKAKCKDPIGSEQTYET